MRKSTWHTGDLDRIVVTEGHKGYTGLRIAVATAKTLCHRGWVVGVSSLLALVPDDLERFGSACHGCPSEQRLHPEFYRMISWSHQKGIFHLRKSRACSDEVSRSPLITAFRSRCLTAPGATYYETLARCGNRTSRSQQAPVGAPMIFIPHYLQTGSKQRKLAQRQQISYINAYDERNNQEGATKAAILAVLEDAWSGPWRVGADWEAEI